MNPVVAALLDRSGDPASVAWVHDGVGELAALPDPDAALAAAVEVGNTAALQAVAAPKALKKAAAAALHKLRSRGVKVEAAVAPRAFSLGKEQVDIPSRAFLSVPDMEGDVELLMTCTDAEGSCVLGVVCGGAAEVREARHAHMQRGELRDLWRQAEGRQDLREIPFVAGLALAERWVTAPQHAHAWHHFLEHVPPGTLMAARVLDPDGTATPPQPESPDALEGWLAPLSLFQGESVEAAARRFVELFRSEVVFDEDARRAEADALVADAADAILTDDRRPAFVAACGLCATTLRWHGRPLESTRVLEAAAAAQAGVPGREVWPVLNTARLAVAATASRLMQPEGAEAE